MTHLHPGDEDLHHDYDDDHQITARTANGRDLEQHERRIKAHLAEHRAIAEQAAERTRKLRELIERGLTFGETVNVFAEGNDDRAKAYVAAARANVRDGEIEVDDPAIVSDSTDPGAYVLAWMWVTDEEAGLSSDDEPSLWFAEGYSVGRYGTTRPVIHQLGAEDTAEFYRGLMRGTFTDPKHGAS